MIGIKVADGKFYPILSENESAKKRIVLTTARDGQESVQIDLYRTATASMQDADFVGSLLVENIARTNKGEPSIELIVTSDEKSGRLSAKAVDLGRPDSADAPLLSVLLGPKGRGDNQSGSERYFTPGKKTANAKSVKKRTPLVIALIGLLCLAAGAVWYFRYGPGTGVLPTGAEAGQEADDGLPADTFDAEAYLREALPPEVIPNGGVVPFDGAEGAVPPQGAPPTDGAADGLSPSEGFVPATPVPPPPAREPPRVNALPAPIGPLLADEWSALDSIVVFC
jgi:hypothetical protein